jgi:hypothetical protein
MKTNNLYNSNSNEELLKIIELLKASLKFYANEDNYKYNTSTGALIDKDKGFQANFILNEVDKLMNYNEVMEVNLNKYLNSIDGINEVNLNNLNEIINKLKEI